MWSPVVRKPISANPRLNRPNPRNKFILRLNSVPRSSVSTIQGLRVKFNTAARWINSLIGWKSSQTNQNGELTVWWLCFNTGLSKERKAIPATWPLRWWKIDVTIFSQMSHPVSGFPAVLTTRTDRCSAISKMFYTTKIMRDFNISALRGRDHRSLAALL